MALVRSAAPLVEAEATAERWSGSPLRSAALVTKSAMRILSGTSGGRSAAPAVVEGATLSTEKASLTAETSPEAEAVRVFDPRASTRRSVKEAVPLPVAEPRSSCVVPRRDPVPEERASETVRVAGQSVGGWVSVGVLRSHHGLLGEDRAGSGPGGLGGEGEFGHRARVDVRRQRGLGQGIIGGGTAGEGESGDGHRLGRTDRRGTERGGVTIGGKAHIRGVGGDDTGKDDVIGHDHRGGGAVIGFAAGREPRGHGDGFGGNIEGATDGSGGGPVCVAGLGGADGHGPDAGDDKIRGERNRGGA